MSDEDRMRLAAGVKAAFNRIEGTKLERCGRLGVSPYSVDRWIAGAGVPRDNNLARLARLAGMTQDEIRNGGTAPDAA